MKMFRVLELLVFWATFSAPANCTEPTSNDELPTDYVGEPVHLGTSTSKQSAGVMQPSWMRGTQHFAILALIAFTGALTITYLVLQCFRALISKSTTGDGSHSDDRIDVFCSSKVSCGLHPESSAAKLLWAGAICSPMTNVGASCATVYTSGYSLFFWMSESSTELLRMSADLLSAVLCLFFPYVAVPALWICLGHSMAHGRTAGILHWNATSTTKVRYEPAFKIHIIVIFKLYRGFVGSYNPH